MNDQVLSTGETPIPVWEVVFSSAAMAALFMASQVATLLVIGLLTVGIHLLYVNWTYVAERFGDVVVNVAIWWLNR